MKPFRIFIFFLAVLLLLLLMAVLFPQQGIGIGGDHRLSFVSIPHLKEEEATDSSSVNIDQLLAGSTVTDDPESDPGMDHFQGIGNQREEKTKIEAKGDAEEKKEKVAEKEAEQEAIAVEPRVIPANVDSLKLHVHRILLPTEGATLLYSFFRNLNKISSG